MLKEKGQEEMTDEKSFHIDATPPVRARRKAQTNRRGKSFKNRLWENIYRLIKINPLSHSHSASHEGEGEIPQLQQCCREEQL